MAVATAWSWEEILLNKRNMSIIFGILMVLTIITTTFTTTLAGKPVPPPGPTLNPKTIPKYTNQLAIPPYYYPTDDGGVDTYTINMVSGYEQQILPTVDTLGNPTNFAKTPSWAYSGPLDGDTVTFSPAATFNATRGTHVRVTWVNDISDNYMFPVDPTLHWADPTYTSTIANPMRPLVQPYPTYPGVFTYSTGGGTSTFSAQTPVPLVPHLHGGETLSWYDGGPEQWFTQDGLKGPDYGSAAGAPANGAVYEYLNTQEPATLWYHDHALGLTRINVMSGLAGFYLLRDPGMPFDDYLTTSFVYGVNEIPLAIQDRSFNADGSFWFDTVGVNPTDHPYWVPEFFGNTIMVNGRVWPNLDVDQGWYRFRLLDGSNARFYTIALKDQTTGAKIPFIQIGSDGGYLKAPATLNSLTIAPGERADILVDFSAIASGTKIIVENKAKAPFPNGVQPDPNTTGQIMQFTVTGNVGFNKGLPIPFPVDLNPTLLGATFPTLQQVALPAGTVNPRTLPLVEVMGALGPLEALLNGQTWMAPTTEEPEVGDTEDWVIPNLTGDTHPIHLHLVQFQLVSRQKFDAAKYNADWIALNADPNVGRLMPPWPNTYTPKPLDVTPYLKGKAQPVPLNEQGWKDTVQMNPGEVTIIRVRFAPQDALTSTAGDNLFDFDPTVGPGYVWHCHIIDHEDNEMMRRYTVVKP